VPEHYLFYLRLVVIPTPDRLGEVRIAREAVALRQDALARIAQLTAAKVTDDKRDAASADAVMADDGGPLGEP
jgi:hypothetical protein